MRRHSIIRCKKKKRYPINTTLFHYHPGYLIIELFKEEAKRDAFITFSTSNPSLPNPHCTPSPPHL